MVWYGMVNVDLYSAIITKVSNALNTLVYLEKSHVFTPCQSCCVRRSSGKEFQTIADQESILISGPTSMLLSVALRLQWKNGPYSAVDGRRLIAVTNTLRALVLGGVHSTVASRANVLATNTDRRCLNSVNRDTHHSTAKHCTVNTFNPRLNITRQSCRKIYYFPKSICISNIREKKQSLH